MVRKADDIHNEDLRVLLAVHRCGGFAAAAEALDASPAYVSKRVGVLESVLGVSLFNRTARRAVLTAEGERVCQRARTVLEEVDLLREEVASARTSARGLMKISSSFAFGRQVVAPVLSRLAAEHPQLEIRFELFDRVVDVVAERFDLDVRVGGEVADNLIAYTLCEHDKVLCAAPQFIARHGAPEQLAQLKDFNCIVTKQRDDGFGVWRLASGTRTETVRVSGNLSSNHGEISLGWVLDGCGITLRSMWEVGPLLASGRLVRVLPDYRQHAPIMAVYPVRLAHSAKLRVCVEALKRLFEAHPPGAAATPAPSRHAASPSRPGGRPRTV